MAAQPAVKLGRAWLLVCLALAVHVADEALTGFLDVYNPTVMALRADLPWLPMPVFSFNVWLGGLIAAIAALSLVSIFVFQGARWVRPIGWFLGVLMTFNALGHALGTIAGRTVSTVHFAGPMPGFYSSPLLFIASIYLLAQLRQTKPGPTAIT